MSRFQPVEVTSKMYKWVISRSNCFRLWHFTQLSELKSSDPEIIKTLYPDKFNVSSYLAKIKKYNCDL
jgi:hypothetical protein